MCAKLIERERLGGAGIDLGTSAFELGVPRRVRVRVRFTIEAPRELEGQLFVIVAPHKARVSNCRSAGAVPDDSW